MKICENCGNEHDRKGKTCSNSCKNKLYYISHRKNKKTNDNEVFSSPQINDNEVFSSSQGLSGLHGFVVNSLRDENRMLKNNIDEKRRQIKDLWAKVDELKEERMNLKYELKLEKNNRELEVLKLDKINKRNQALLEKVSDLGQGYFAMQASKNSRTEPHENTTHKRTENKDVGGIYDI